MNPRWRKVISDLLSNKTRTILTVLSIAVGVFAVGMIAEAGVSMSRGLAQGYQAGNPFSAVIFTRDTFDDDLVETVWRMPEVAAVEGRRSLNVRLSSGPDQWETLTLFALPDFNDIRVSKMQPECGAWPPPERTMLIERSALSSTLSQFSIAMGDQVLIETPDNEQHSLTVSGIVHDLNVAPTFIFGTYYGYITLDTLEWLGEPRAYDSLLFTAAGDNLDLEQVNVVAKQVRDQIEKSGRVVESTFIPPEPGKSPIASFGLDPTILILSVLGALALVLSGFLVTNTISAILAQQIRQIGVMKTLGARTSQIVTMYVALVLCFGLLGLAVALIPAALAARAFTALFADLFNFDPVSYGIIPEILALNILVSLLVPLLAAIVPLLRGIRVTVREAIDDHGIGGHFGSSWMDRVLERIRGFSRPLLLSLRNTFRRKGRLSLTLLTLMVGGATFIAVFSVQASLSRSLDEVDATLLRYDVAITLDRPQRMERIIQEALSIPGVSAVETWGVSTARRLRPNDTESETIVVQAPPADTPLLEPEIVQGRWLLPQDENALVVSTGLLDDEPDIRVGETVTLKLRGRETNWQVVGVFKSLGSNLIAFANYPYFARELGELDQAGAVRIVTTQHDGPFQEQVARDLEEHFRSIGLRISETSTSVADRREVEEQFGIIGSNLFVMAILTALVGGLSLMGTLSMNVLERTREFGVMRAIGASNGSVFQIVVVEGLLIGLLSCALGAVLAWPISRLLSDGVGNAFLGAPFSYTFSLRGIALWFGASIVIATAASLLPAWNASRLAVRDVLAYE
jgi:putative ABC transport system permease protein